MIPRSKLAILLLITSIAFLFIFSCSKKEDSLTSPSPGTNTADLISVSPSSGAPGSVLTLNNFQFDSSLVDNYIAYIGDEEAPIRLVDGSIIQVAIPIFWDSTIGWATPPTDSVSLEIILNGKLIAYTDTTILIDSLPHASGTTEAIKQSIDSVLTYFEILLSEVPNHTSWEQEYRDSLLSVVNSLINGPDTSLAAIMNGTSSLLDGMPADLELTDAILATTGVLDYWNEYLSVFSSSVRKLQRRINRLESESLLCSESGPDMDLACKMQLYVLIDDWANEFIANTRTEWEASIGWVIDAIAIIPAASQSPPIVVGQLIGAILTITDIMTNNVVLSVLPSRITNFNMIVDPDIMEVDQFTNSQIYITAANSPEQMSINEMIDLVMTAIGFKSTADNPQFKMIVLQVIQYIVDKLRSVYSWLSTVAPDVFINPDLIDGSWYGFPDLTWGPVEVTSNDLVELFSFTPDILEPDTAVYEWWSVDCGEGRIQARTRAAGERSKVVRDWLFCIGCEYSGGAFGEEIEYSEVKSVDVGTDGNLEIIVDGLPEGEDADIIVIYPDGATFDYISSTDTLNELESGQYEVQANEVTASDGTVYVGKPATQIADISCDNTVTSNIEYVNKYGNILLTISGLRPGTPPDVVITGPDNYLKTVTAEGLIDSLIEGDYIITAIDVIDPGSGDTLTATPHSQTVTVVAGQTSTASVDYLGDLQVNVIYGPPPSPSFIGAVVTDDGISYIYDNANLSAEYKTNGCDITGPIVTSIVSGTGQQDSEFGGGNSSALLTVKQNGFSIEASSSGSAHLPDRPNSSVEAASGSSNIYFGSSGSDVYRNTGIALEIINPSEDTVEIYVSWSSNPTGTGTTPGSARATVATRAPSNLCNLASVTVLSNCIANNYQFHCIGDSTFITTLAHSFMLFSASTSAGGFVVVGDDPTFSEGSVSLNLDVTVRKP